MHRFLIPLLALAASAAPAAEGDVTLPAGTIPFPAHASAEARAVFARDVAVPGKDWTKEPIAAARAHYDAINGARARRMHAIFPVTIRAGRIGGVPVEIIEPRGGVPAANRGRVLLNVHGGAFLWGAGSGGRVEAIPIAAEAGVRVIAIDYRMAPEHLFPAGSDDVVAVYRALLADHAPAAIGIYGCSAGSILTGEAVAAIAAQGLPRPGAIGLFCAGITDFDGDGAYISPALSNGALPTAAPPITARGYFARARQDDPLVLPAVDPKVVAAFPPTLLISGTRDFALSAVLRSHRALVAQAVPAELHVWDGMWHSFFSDAELPESREAYRVIARFFNRTLAR